MPTNAERFYESLRTAEAVLRLKGIPEDANFDCKRWNGQKSSREQLAKAACGFTNATGGVLIIGMEARKGHDGADVVQDECPVQDVEAVRSDALDAISKIVEPGIEGIRSRAVRMGRMSKDGFVVMFIPESEGTPQRSLATKEFYVRIGPQTLPMPYFQIADRFGRRPKPQLVAEIEVSPPQGTLGGIGFMQRRITLRVSNRGRGIARFPAVRYPTDNGVTTPAWTDTGQPIWKVSNANRDWVSFRGGANDVVYPGESLELVSLIQRGHQDQTRGPWLFPAIEFVVETICEGMPARQQTLIIEGVQTQP